MKTYIEAGANDGIFQSRSLGLQNHPEYQGILIEPLHDMYLSCISNRLNERTKIYHCGLVPFEYTQENVDINLHNLHTAMATIKHLDPIEYPNKITVPARTLTSILDENNITDVDIFYLDVEGYEYEVLHGVDFSKINIKTIEIELHYSLPGFGMTAQEEMERHASYLSNYYYKFNRYEESGQHHKLIAEKI
jgi:FkbM family methyltransferase